MSKQKSSLLTIRAVGDIEMNFFKSLSSVIFSTAILAALGAKADAAVIPIVNPTFGIFPAGQTAATYLNFGCGTGCAFADNNTVGWTQSATRSASADEGQFQIGPVPSTTSFNSDPTTGELIVLRAINATASQTVSTPVVAGETFTLDVDLGFEKFDYDEASVFLIVDGHQVLAKPLAFYNLTQSQMQKSGNWYDFEASYTAPSADPGGSVEVLLSSLTNGKGYGFFGDVRLTDSLSASSPPAAPELATWAMMLIGFGGIAGVAAVRRWRTAGHLV
jgi:hypothetical protein